MPGSSVIPFRAGVLRSPPARLLVACAIVSLPWLVAGCGPGEPSVATDVPPATIKHVERWDPMYGARPKGKPKRTSSGGAPINPSTGRLEEK
jgi:hypothetical protein